MEAWDLDYVELEGPAFIRIEPDGRGSFHFGAVDGIIDHRTGDREGRPVVEFTWDGTDEMDAVCGRGFAIVNADELVGRIFIHLGMESGFRATRLHEVPAPRGATARPA